MFSRAYAREALLRRARGVIWALRAVSVGNVTGFESLWVSFVVGGVKSIRGFLRQFAKYPLPINV